MAYCPNCGKQVDIGMQFCASCGQSLEQLGILINKKKKNKNPLIAADSIVSLAVIVVLIFVNIFWVAANKSPDNNAVNAGDNNNSIAGTTKSSNGGDTAGQNIGIVGNNNNGYIANIQNNENIDDYEDDNEEDVDEYPVPEEIIIYEWPVNYLPEGTPKFPGDDIKAEPTTYNRFISIDIYNTSKEELFKWAEMLKNAGWTTRETVWETSMEGNAEKEVGEDSWYCYYTYGREDENSDVVFVHMYFNVYEKNNDPVW